MTTEDKVDGQVEQEVGKKDKPKLYFFILAILALLATNVYFYVKFKSSGEKLYTVTLQRENLQIEIDRIEAELDNIAFQEVADNQDIVASETEARQTIAELRSSLEDNNLDEGQIDDARERVIALRENVMQIHRDLDEHKLKNELLRKENELLAQQVEQSNTTIENLSSQNSELTDQISQASGIKTSNIHVSGVNVKKNGRMDQETRARRIDLIQIQYTLADNPFASIGDKDVYLRIINPKGNLIADAENVFYVHGEKLQFTLKENIDFTNKGETYQILWEDPKGFSKGAYTVLLYSDNAIMGRASIVLN